MVKIILAIFILGVIVALHEFGHFIVAKLCGIRVNQFAIGMGPAILKKQWGETEYSLRLLPIGGFCAMEGEDADSEDSRAFGKKSVPRRMAVVVAGATMNILLGFVLLIITTSMGDAITTTTISRFHADENGNSTSSSESCGLQVNDTIVRINGMRILTDTDLSYKLQYTNENDFTVDVRRNGEIVTLEHVRFEDTATTGRLDFWVYGQKTTVGNVLAYAAKDTVSIARMTWVGLLDLIRGNVGFHDMSGPVGIVNAIGDAATIGETLREHVMSLLALSTLVTINLGFCNLLPLPALDGGRLVFLIIEAIRRKPVKPEHEGMVHLVGMALLMLLMLAVTYNDIAKLI